MTLKCISLWQPWAEAMRMKLKKNETRHWPTRHRGWLAIHAAKKLYVPKDYDDGFNVFVRESHLGPLAYGAVVCIVKMVGCEPTARIADLISDEERFWGDYSDGRFAWTTWPNSIIQLPAPIPLRGHQGLFDWQVPVELEAELAL
jgi:hypothetical protein